MKQLDLSRLNTVQLVPPTPFSDDGRQVKYDELSRTKLLDPVGTGLGRAIVWSHPAYAMQCVFARNDQEIVCFSLAKE